MHVLLPNLEPSTCWVNRIHRLDLLPFILWPMKLDISTLVNSEHFRCIYVFYSIHSLGMHHDAVGNECTSEGFVMSPSRGTEGETLWSTCSADIIRTLGDWAKCLHDKPTNVSVAYNSWKYEGYPGQRITAKQQCQLLLV